MHYYPCCPFITSGYSYASKAHRKYLFCFKFKIIVAILPLTITVHKKLTLSFTLFVFIKLISIEGIIMNALKALLLLANAAAILSTNPTIATNKKNAPKEISIATLVDQYGPEALTTLKSGRLDMFDALCGDTSCQMRVPIVIDLYKKYGTTKNINDVALKDAQALATLYFLTTIKRIDPKRNDETISEKTVAKALAIGKDPAKKIIKIAKAYAASIAIAHLTQKVKTFLPEFDVIMGNTKLKTTPCLCSINALFDYLQQNKIPLVMRSCGENFAQPFIMESDDETKIAAKKHVIAVIGTQKKLAPETPVCIIDGIIDGDANDKQSYFEKLSSDEFKNIVLVNAALHYQLGGEYKNKTLDQIFTSNKNSEQELLVQYKNLLKTQDLKKAFKIQHICASTYDKIGNYATIQLMERS